MTIAVGDRLPDVPLAIATPDGPQPTTSGEYFKGKKVALFAVPGAYTGTCHKMHLPSIFLNAYANKDKGVNTIAIVSVNDAFVLSAWKRDTDQRDEATFLADGNADFTKAIGMELDAIAAVAIGGTLVAIVGMRASCQPMPVLMIVAPARWTAFASASIETSRENLPAVLRLVAEVLTGGHR